MFCTKLETYHQFLVESTQIMTKQPLEVWCTTMSLLRHNPQDVAWLIHESAPELFALIFGSKAIPLLTDFVQRSHNRFSYKNIRVAQAGDRVLGIAIILKAEDIHDNADDRTVLSSWQKLRLQLAQRLILSRILQHDYPTGSFYISQETHCVESEMGVSSKPKAKAFFLRLLTTRSRYRCS
ncbi:hypothetical protein A6770_16645 [Nostoc minutum NIES-26]|uniref:Uncharacterized protein n=1 Tax=Nostoc minutum NIES-26 TaxID=1844469 RepID=A0A367RJC5_9NOSO|nr:hypothetical protein A6770_16645 [Nostoc minutum NIES-26]